MLNDLSIKKSHRADHSKIEFSDKYRSDFMEQYAQGCWTR
jgi:hypothetical protein